jgi:hypothetical protein
LSSETIIRSQVARGGNLEIRDFFDGQAVADVVVHRREVVVAIGVGHKAVVGHRLADLLGAAMDVADIGARRGDDLAVGRDHHAQHAVRRRVLRPHVDFHVLGAHVEDDLALAVGASILLDDPRARVRC